MLKLLGECVFGQRYVRLLFVFLQGSLDYQLKTGRSQLITHFGCEFEGGVGY